MQKNKCPLCGTEYDALEKQCPGCGFSEHDLKTKKDESPPPEAGPPEVPVVTITSTPVVDVPMKWFHRINYFLCYPASLLCWLVISYFGMFLSKDEAPTLFPCLLMAEIDLSFSILGFVTYYMLHKLKWNGVIASHVFLFLLLPVCAINVINLLSMGGIDLAAEWMGYALIISAICGTVFLLLNIQYFNKRKHLFSQSAKH